MFVVTGAGDAGGSDRNDGVLGTGAYSVAHRVVRTASETMDRRAGSRGVVSDVGAHGGASGVAAGDTVLPATSIWWQAGATVPRGGCADRRGTTTFEP